MSISPPGFMARLALAWRVLTDAALAARVERPAPVEPPTPAAPPLQSAAPDAALQVLGLLQQEGRLIDFLEEDIATYSDAEIGGAVRGVHEGCRKVLRQYFTIEPIAEVEEGARMTLERGFDAGAYRVTGNVVGEPPFTGTLAHRGWRTSDSRLPRVATGHDVGVLAPAEVEL
jgi:hypothetical protein